MSKPPLRYESIKKAAFLRLFGHFRMPFANVLTLRKIFLFFSKNYVKFDDFISHTKLLFGESDSSLLYNEV